jgi:putative ABC transport system ATP-binding protein
MSALIEVRDLGHYYGKGKLKNQILFDINAEIHSGEIVILTGPSGSGKTTLLTLMGALRSAQEGELSVLGENLRNAKPRLLESVRRQIGYIFQAHNLLDALTVSQNIEMSLYLHRHWKKSAAKVRVMEMLQAVGLEEHAEKFPAQLSGGQKQRVAIARALVSEPKIVLADEPTASLDKKAGREVVELMRSLARDLQVTVIIVTHDNRILDVADRIIHLEDGHIQSGSEVVAANTSQMLKIMEKHDPSAMRYISAYAKALVRIANVDNNITEDEIAEIRKQLATASDLSDAEINLTMELTLANTRVGGEGIGHSSIANFSLEHKKHFVQTLYAVANADGHLDDDEKREIETIAKELGLSTE